ncbi:putative oxalocrotonate tautomerase [Achaetomium macrosporum]|uniref:Oxalocrotonate tautomerase n=1 Tax=Achaetomium macrosporum TaxID=79813 RepID=A0AAN7CCY4_9PEZI|nr:putative oxalocrotonate tautomerase [Achaetomium macrosporum]
MPLWLIFHPEEAFSTPESKQSLAADITSIYTRYGLPAFYVVVNFIPQPAVNTFVGGQNPSKPFVRFVVDHIAVHLGDNGAQMERIAALVDAALKPHVADKGYNWEYHIDETPRGLWKINGFAPPPFRSEAEKKWFELNRAVEWEKPPGASL